MNMQLSTTLADSRQFGISRISARGFPITIARFRRKKLQSAAKNDLRLLLKLLMIREKRFVKDIVVFRRDLGNFLENY